MAAATKGMQEERQERDVWAPGKELTHWIATRQLPIANVLGDLDWKDAVRLASTSPLLWKHVEQLVTLAKPDWGAALDPATPNRLRIPLLTGLTRLTREQVRANSNQVLSEVCGQGRLEVAQWLTDRFGLTAGDARANNNYALRYACASGYLDVTQWLEERFGIRQEEINEIPRM